MDRDGLVDLTATAGHEVGDKAVAAVTAAFGAVAKLEPAFLPSGPDPGARC